ncbi:MAG: cyanophycin synthetase [Desulfitobacteriaceae bacterium]
MEIKSIQSIEGASVHSHRPIIRAIVDLQDRVEVMSNQLGDFNHQLVACLPTLVDHYCSRGKPGGFLERLEEGTLLGHILEHVTIELLTLAGQTVNYGKTMSVLESPGKYEIIFNYKSKEGAIEALQQAFALIQGLLRGETSDISKIINTIRNVIEDNSLGASTQAIVDACIERGIPVQRLNDRSLLQLGYGQRQRRVQAAMTDKTSCIATDISCDKGLTKSLLSSGGIPVPTGSVVWTEEEAVTAFRKIGGPVVVKPYNGNQGKGVTLRLTTDAEVRTAFRVAQAYGNEIIVEEHIEGYHYRLLVIGGRLVAAARRIPACVVGDGRSSIEELVEQVNLHPQRGQGHQKALTKIKIDPVVVLALAQRNLSIYTVPLAGEIVYLRESANLSTGGVAEDVTDLVHPDNANLAIYAAQIVGLDIAGVDLVIEDIGESFRKSKGYIIEVNAAPGIRMHHYPSFGRERNVGKEIVNMVMPRGNGRIPIVAVTGTNGKTTTTRMIGRMLMNQQLKVGLATTDGIFVNGNLLIKGDTTGPESARIILRHPEVQVAVLETARGGILRAGLGYDYADIAVITNVSNDHLGQFGIETIEDIAHVKSLVTEVVQTHSYVILNADDAKVLEMGRRTKGKVIYFSTEKDNIHVRKHLAKGGIAVFVRRGIILLCHGIDCFRICTVKQVPITWEGKAKHNIQNVLAAVAAGWCLGLSAEAIRNSLEGFTTGAEDNRGRLNHYELGGVQIFIDYGHNAAGIQEIIQTLKKFKGRSLVGCVTVPGDRPDESIRDVARVAAKGFQRLIIREDEDLRGRKPGEIAGIIYNAAVETGMDPKCISVVLAEQQAFQFGLDTCMPGDVFVMFYENIESIEEEIAHRLSQENNSKLSVVQPEAVAGGGI